MTLPEWASPAVTAAGMILSALGAWLVKSTKQGKDVETMSNNLLSLRDDHQRQLDKHGEDIEAIQSNFVSRRELDEKLALYFAPINKQLDQQTRMLEFVAFGTMPDHPLLKSGEQA